MKPPENQHPQKHFKITKQFKDPARRPQTYFQLLKLTQKQKINVV